MSGGFPSRRSPRTGGRHPQASEGWWTRSQRTRTAAQLALEVALVEAAPPPVYQLIAARAKQLSRLGLTNVQVARALGVSDKTAAKAIAWQAAFSTQPPET